MPIPDYETLMLPVLRLFADGAQNVAECLPKLREQFEITDEEAGEMLHSGRQTLLSNRAHWARTYLAKAGLLTSPKRNLHVITDLGRKVIASNPDRLDNDVLSQFEEFTDWIDQSRAGDFEKPGEDSGQAKVTPVNITPIDERQTPEDAMEGASGLLDAALSDELLALLHQLSPQRFEQVILDLLTAMGYGGGDAARGLATKTTGDGVLMGLFTKTRWASMLSTSKPNDMPQTIGSGVRTSSGLLDR